MLKFLKISNLAVIRNLDLEFEGGLNLLTGETGSGKSIIVDAVSLLFGDRSSSDLVRSGEERATIEGLFIIEASGVEEICRAAGLELPGGEIIIRREIYASGRSRAFVNERLVSLAFLKEIRPRLVDIHGQGESQTLLVPRTQAALLDAYAGVEALSEHVRDLAERYWQLRSELDRLRTSEAERLRMLDVYDFQIAEIEKAKPRAGEDEELQKERRLLVNAERVYQLTSDSYAALYESDESVLRRLGRVKKWLQQVAEVDAQFRQVEQELERVQAVVEDVAYFIREYIGSLDFAAGRLDEVEARLAELERLKRKYGPTLEDVLSSLEAMKRERERLLLSDVQKEELEREVEKIERDYLRAAEQLREARHRAARQLERAIRSEVRQLAMEQIRFDVAFHPVEVIPSVEGLERVEFLVATNVGESLKPLGRVVSGGELSRLMLALKVIGGRMVGPRTLIFDEIDAGIGGRVAELVGQRLKQLAATHQVFCVTHLPQIAKFADVHYRVRKEVDPKRGTEVQVDRLSQEERVTELARMLAGERVTEITRRHARELLRTV
ncbi:MAG TPA: DNA repair protein RecN [Blastocatellia bacterium]|nr:DNA repair protein RecN [Blastocatellia bacterium]